MGIRTADKIRQIEKGLVEIHRRKVKKDSFLLIFPKLYNFGLVSVLGARLPLTLSSAQRQNYTKHHEVIWKS